MAKPLSVQIDDILREIDKAVALLMTFNHAQAWEYDWEFFEIAGEVVKEVQKNFTISITSGISLLFSKKDEIEQFIKG